MRLTIHCTQPGCNAPAIFLFEWENRRVAALCPTHNAILGTCIRAVLDAVAEIDLTNAWDHLAHDMGLLKRVDPSTVGRYPLSQSAIQGETDHPGETEPLPSVDEYKRLLKMWQARK